MNVYEYQELYSEDGTQEITNDSFSTINDSTEIETMNAIGVEDTELIDESSEYEPLDYPKEDDEQEMHYSRDFNLKDFYSFVGNNKNEKVTTDNESSDIMEDTRKPKQSSSKSITTDQGSAFNDD